MQPEQILFVISIYALPILLAITLHEAAHGFAAYKLGDSTAWMLGRVTLNPLKHIDPVGTLLLPMALAVMGLPVIGYAKPVPVNFMRLKPRRLGMALVALAGPCANFILLFLSIGLLYLARDFLTGDLQSFVANVAFASVMINIVLMAFNLLPIPPLDGSRVLQSVLPARFEPVLLRYEQIAMVVLIVLAITGILGQILSPVLQVVLAWLSPLMPR